MALRSTNGSASVWIKNLGTAARARYFVDSVSETVSVESGTKYQHRLRLAPQTPVSICMVRGRIDNIFDPDSRFKLRLCQLREAPMGKTISGKKFCKLVENSKAANHRVEVDHQSI